MEVSGSAFIPHTPLGSQDSEGETLGASCSQFPEALCNSYKPLRSTQFPWVDLVLLRSKSQWSSGSASDFHTTGPGSIPSLGKVDSAFHPFSGSINEIQACLGTKTLWILLQTDHLIGTSVHAPQRPMVTYTGMGTVAPVPHGLLHQ
ncbi:hypothetical protein TNCV_2219131 [Trichonephila clavipes]|nr:hypothetical protein TNCV_2219131 [Trichonephila clavipes]